MGQELTANLLDHRVRNFIDFEVGRQFYEESRCVLHKLLSSVPPVINNQLRIIFARSFDYLSLGHNTYSMHNNSYAHRWVIQTSDFLNLRLFYLVYCFSSFFQDWVGSCYCFFTLLQIFSLALFLFLCGFFFL